MKNRACLAWIALWFTAALAMRGADLRHHLERTLGAPSLAHPLGFDAFGRDLLKATLAASAASATFALTAALATCVLGIGLGSAIAIAPARPRFLALRAIDTFLAFPSLLIALGWAAIRGPGWDTLLVALAIGILPSFTRLIYARAREILAEDYVAAARSLGAGNARVIHRHLVPALTELASIKAPGLFAHALLAEATLSFLGVGAPVGRDTWGALLAQGKDYLLEAPHLAAGAGLPLVITVLTLQILSERRFTAI
jgi:peptide/nickel transport system permease protein